MSLTVTHIAHAGFLLAGGGKKALIDALTYPPPPLWKHGAPPRELADKIKKGQPPFDGVDLMLVSQVTGDHFGPPLVVDFLRNNPLAVLVTTSEARRYAEGAAGYPAVDDRVIVPALDWKQSVVRDVGGIRLEVARLKIGNFREWPVVVYSFLFDLGGKKILYAAGTGGFFPEEYKELGWAQRGIDLAFLCADDLLVRFDYEKKTAVLNPDGLRMVREMIAPRVPVMMHVEPELVPAAEKLLPDLEKELPGLVWLHTELESKEFAA
jgi:L-ascorbate metabolism protein UlaG (beta-lactamase superfamily)